MEPEGSARRRRPGRARPRALRRAAPGETPSPPPGPGPAHAEPGRLDPADARLRRLDPADARLRRLDRLAGVGLLAAEVAHEARNALTAVKTFLQLLPRRGYDPELRGGLGRIAAEETARIERLLELLLEQAAPGRAPTPELAGTGDAARALSAVARLVSRRAAAAGVRLEAEIPEALPPVPMADDALRQVLLNLVLNALEATPAGGDVRLVARSLGPAVELAVEDRGPGIPPERRERVFEAFVSDRAEGVGGLGLAIARRLVEEAGGLVAIGDRPEGGARLRIRLPVLR